MVAPRGRSFLDRPAARGLAALVLLACLAALAWIERERLLGREDAAASAPDPAAACIAERAAEIDAMLAEGVIEAPQAELFKSRAQAMCRATVEGGASGPSLPAN